PAFGVLGASAQCPAQGTIPTIPGRKRRCSFYIARVHILLQLIVFFSNMTVCIDHFEMVCHGRLLFDFFFLLSFVYASKEYRVKRELCYGIKHRPSLWLAGRPRFFEPESASDEGCAMKNTYSFALLLAWVLWARTQGPTVDSWTGTSGFQ